MDYFKEILKGVFIGVANIIPGVSGGTIALSMGVYEKIIEAINNLKKDFKNSAKTLLPYVIGAVLGILVLAILIEFLLDKFPFPTVFAFIGLIIGGLPSIYNRVKNEKIKVTHIISFVIFALVIIVPTIVSNNVIDTAMTLEVGIVPILIMLALGTIAAASMVVPGVSGSMILMMLGYYETILSSVSACVKSLIKFDFATCFHNLIFLIPFGIGVIVGIFLAAKIIEKLLKKYPNTTMWGIIALVVTSPFAILYGMNFASLNVIGIIASVITFVLGYFVASKLGKE